MTLPLGGLSLRRVRDHQARSVVAPSLDRRGPRILSSSGLMFTLPRCESSTFIPGTKMMTFVALLGQAPVVGWNVGSSQCALALYT